MKPIAEGLWETITPVRMAGVSMPARTVLIELSGGGLLVHSPGTLDSDTREAIERLGPVRGLISPNSFHHMFVAQWREAYPEAAVYATAALIDKHEKLADAERLTNEAPSLWAADMEQHEWVGIPKIGEVIFVHKPTKTLINTDMMHNMNDEPRWFARTAWKMLGSYKKFGPSLLERWWTKDKPGLRASVERVLSWDFDRVTVAHGDVLETGGKDNVRDGWHWVLR